MKAVLALAMGAAALAPSQPKVNNSTCATYPAMTQRQKAADEAARRRPEAALCAATALQPCRVLRAAQMAGKDAFLGFTPASAEELSDAGRAAPDTAHAAAAGRRAPTGLHTYRAPRSAAVSRWLRKRAVRERDTNPPNPPRARPETSRNSV